MTRRVLACLFFAGALTLLAKADGPAPSAKPDGKDDTITANSPIVVTLRDQQTNLKEQYKDIKAHVNEIAEQMKNSSDPEKQEKGKAISKALEGAGDQIERKFEELEGLLKTPSQQKVETAKTRVGDLRRDLQDLIKQLKEADKGPDRKKEIEALSRILDELKRLAREQDNARTNTELNRRNKEDLGKVQNDITKGTGKLIGKGEAKGNPGGEAKAGDAKGEGKNANGDPKGEGKNDTNKPKGDDKSNKGEEKPGTTPKDPKGAAGEAKGGKPGGDPKSGQAGESKSGGKGDPKEGQKGDSKGDPKKGDPSKPNDPKKDDPKDNKSDSKGKSDGKGEAKGEPKGGKPSDGKPSDSKSGGEGSPKAGGSKPSGSKQQPPPDSGNQPKKEQFPGKQQVEDAHEAEKGAEKEIDKGDNDAAAKKQKEASDKLKEAQKEIEARLRELRKDEIDRILSDMLGRCNKMLSMEKDVRDDTVRLDKAMQGRSKDRADVNKGDEMAKKQGEIIKIADDAIQLLREEGTSVAFPEVLDFVRNLMRDVRTRLSNTDPKATTQATEDEIIRNLEEMIAALEKAKKENQQQPPPPGQPGSQNPNPGNRPLLQELQELKLIRNMQVSVHKMTEAYGSEYKGKEQAPAPEKAQTPAEKEKAMALKGYLDDLSKRQEKIFEVTNDLYKGKNK